MAFKVGQKVVCVAKVSGIAWCGEFKGQYSGNNTVLGEIYTISGFSSIGSVRLFELPVCPDGFPQAFRPSYFKPLDYEFVEEVIKQVTPKEVEA